MPPFGFASPLGGHDAPPRGRNGARELHAHDQFHPTPVRDRTRPANAACRGCQPVGRAGRLRGEADQVALEFGGNLPGGFQDSARQHLALLLDEDASLIRPDGVQPPGPPPAPDQLATARLPARSVERIVPPSGRTSATENPGPTSCCSMCTGSQNPGRSSQRGNGGAQTTPSKPRRPARSRNHLSLRASAAMRALGEAAGRDLTIQRP